MSLITPEAPRRFYRRWMDCLVPVILGCLISDEALGAQRMRLGTLVPKGSSYYNHLKTMESAWKRSPGGGVSISIYPDGRLGGGGRNGPSHAEPPAPGGAVDGSWLG